MLTKKDLRKLGDGVNKYLENLKYHVETTRECIVKNAKHGESSYVEAIIHGDLNSKHIETYLATIKKDFPDIDVEICPNETTTHYVFSWND